MAITILIAVKIQINVKIRIQYIRYFRGRFDQNQQIKCRKNNQKILRFNRNDYNFGLYNHDNNDKKNDFLETVV